MDDLGPGSPIFGNTHIVRLLLAKCGTFFPRQWDVNISLQSWLIAFRCSLLMSAAVFKLHMLHSSLLIQPYCTPSEHTHKSHKQEVRSTTCLDLLLFCVHHLCIVFVSARHWKTYNVAKKGGLFQSMQYLSTWIHQQYLVGGFNPFEKY